MSTDLGYAGNVGIEFGILFLCIPEPEIQALPVLEVAILFPVEISIKKGLNGICEKADVEKMCRAIESSSLHSLLVEICNIDYFPEITSGFGSHIGLPEMDSLSPMVSFCSQNSSRKSHQSASLYL